MMKEKDLDLIEKFYNNQLTEVEKSDFDNRKASDADFAKSVELFEVSQVIIKNNHRARLQTDAQSYMGELESSSKQRFSFFLNRKLQLAAAVLLLVGAVFLIRNLSLSSSPQKLFTQYFEVPRASNLRSPDSSADEMWNQVTDAYNKQSYSQAIEVMNDLLKNEELNFKDRVHFYLGMSYLSNDNLEESIANLNLVKEGSSYHQQATWYETLALLKSNDTKNATILLREIEKDKSHYKNKIAKEILEEL